jgi:uncharacterized repeat protein (TIGR02543 family)
MTIKRGLLPFLTLTITLIFSACFSPWKGEQGTVTVNVGSGNKTVSWLQEKDINIEDLLHIITITGPGPKQEARFIGEGTAFFTTAPGTWKIDVKAYYDDRGGFGNFQSIYDIPIDNLELVAVGSASVDVKAGKSNPVSITMGPAGGGEPPPPHETFTLKVGVITGQNGSWNKDTVYGTVTIKATDGSGLEPEQEGELEPWTMLDIPAGTPVTITATGETNYTFVKWVTEDDITKPACNDNDDGVLTLPITSDLADSEGNITLYAVFDGDGTTTPKNITSVLDLNGIGTTTSFLSRNYALMTDLDFDKGLPSTMTYTPKGSVPTNPFTGTFDGRGHTINLGTNKVSLSPVMSVYIGLFGCIGTTGTVKNFNLKGLITYTEECQNMYAGAVAGLNLGTIQNVVSSVSLSIINNYNFPHTVYCGGIAGSNGGSSPTSEPRQITNCAVIADITATTTENDGKAYTGGIAGQNNGTISTCWTSGGIEGTIQANAVLNSYAGGIAGQMQDSDAKIEKCVALNTSITSSITSTDTGSTANAGRIVGAKSSSSTLISNYAATMTLTAGNTPVTVDPDANKEHGADFTNATDQSSWMGANSPDWTFSNLNYANESSPWVWGSGKPKLWFEIKD